MTTETLTRTDTLLLGPATLSAVGPADPLMGSTRETYGDHLDRLGGRPRVTAALVRDIERAGLLGHGGAFVPVALKWRSALARQGHLTVVANAAESEPLAGKDGTLLRQRPHLVLDGLQVTAQSLGADRLVVWLHGDDDGGRAVLRLALAERTSPHDLPVEIVDGPVHYLAGEAQAITRAMAGGPPLPFPRRNGVDPRQPQTLVHNVETLARIALLARGLPVPDTRLLSVLGSRRYVVEVAQQTTIEQVLIDLGWKEAPQAVLLGGYAGIWTPWETIAQLPVEEKALRAVKLTLGAGVVVPLAADACGIQATADLVGWLASMSARQCGPCLFGLPALAEHWSQLASGEVDRRTLSRMYSDVESVEGRGACRHPDGATRLIRSAATTFAEHLEDHASGSACRRRLATRMPGVSR